MKPLGLRVSLPPSPGSYCIASPRQEFSMCWCYGLQPISLATHVKQGSVKGWSGGIWGALRLS